MLKLMQTQPVLFLRLMSKLWDCLFKSRFWGREGGMNHTQVTEWLHKKAYIWGKKMRECMQKHNTIMAGLNQPHHLQVYREGSLKKKEL